MSEPISEPISEQELQEIEERPGWVHASTIFRLVSEVRRLRARLEAVLELHQEDMGKRCTTCDEELEPRFPCETRRAAEGSEE